ncbi:type IV pilus assembly protein PilY1 [Litorivivens lipolytica]|uniref:Type IV pilus assembly protein PilY1 n=1 Tax=Litorivivens lipolytica TaxID=1524264 RepID=A0A7W4W8D2_9GAMM|nr:PilC/PilY family type IV pilus protein [Litorivivens lipolytica]MBB3048717.1 type IV pilus assembly protein PilY1 [Litorivivens lipolytica]
MKTATHDKTILTMIFGLITASANSAVDIAQTPLSQATGAPPNILLAIDDSGSMDSEVLLPTNDGALWWNTDTQGFVGLNANDEEESGVLNVNAAGSANGTWKKYVYLFPNGTGTGKRIYGDSDNDHFAVPPTAEFAFARSPDFNRAYFNPADIYAPWPSAGDTAWVRIDPTSAPSDPARGDASFNLTQSISSDSTNNVFTFFRGMKLPDGSTVDEKTNMEVSYYPATFYLKEALHPDLGYTGATLTGKAPDGSNLIGYEIKSANFQTTDHYNAMIRNFANWFSYYRKRHLATRAGVAHSFFDVRNARVGEFTINNRSDVTMHALSDSSERNSFFNTVYSRGGNSGGTPNRPALKHAGDQLKRTGSSAPITHACQSNAAILFTDGYSNPDDVGIGNEDGDKGAPYADSESGTMADIAMKYYANHLRDDLDTGKVPLPEACSRNDRSPALDCNSNLHMLTYAVTLGSRGFLFDPDNPIDPYANPPAWPTDFPVRSPTAVDDLWHATINGRGQLLNASKPVEIATKLKAAVTRILQSVGSASAVATNSTRLDTDTLVFQARYDSRDWSGQILAYKVASDGKLDSLEWSTDSSGKIPAYDVRKLFTWSPANSDGAAFTWNTLDSSQQSVLTADITDTAVASVLGPQRLQWLRGDRRQEGSNTAFRIRSKVLGDVINSNPYFHWKQDYGFSKLGGTEGPSYSGWLESKASKSAMIYVGANDGMLHAFKANTGEEQFGYVPAGVFNALYTLTKPDYSHRYFVDGSPRVLDAYINNAWRSILIGATGAGGRSIFALDVSDPENFDADDVLWEFSTTTSSTDKLGVAMSEPVIARLESGDWVAIFGNGYNSGDTVKLFIVNLSDGSLLKAIDTKVSGTDNGLSSVVPVDEDGDRITDTVYAGDLAGNIWKFDLTSSNRNGWGVAYGTNTTPAPLFVARDTSNVAQPITSRIAVGRHPEEGVMVYVGTGKYLESSDSTVGDSPQVQTFYGLQDKGAVIDSRSDLQEQTISAQGSRALNGTNNRANADLRVVSSSNVDYSSKKGWYLDLKLSSASHGSGERVIDQAILRYDRIIFATMAPSADPCNFGGTSWLMELNAMTGGRLDEAVFDANDDGVINSADMISSNNTLIAPSGKHFDEMISRPGIIGAGEKEYKYTSGSRGSLGMTTERGAGTELGRQSWWQLR